MSTPAPPPSSLQAALQSLVGDRVRPATPADAVAGVQPRVAVEPEDEEEAAAILAFADGEGLKVLPRGGGTQLGTGFPPRGGDILLSLARLNRVVEHAPGDMTVTVEAGLSLAGVQEALAPAGQWLALDPALPPAATIGGIVATAASGPRRLRYGGPRDQIIGVRIVRADGTIAKGGGKVVKNVAGFDLPKLFTGSLGTLGVIVAATFRLYPRPAASRTVLISAPDPAPLCDLALRVIASTLVASTIDVAGATPAGEGAGCQLAVRFEGLEEATETQARGLIELAGPLGEGARIAGGDEEEGLWRDAAAGLGGAGTGPAPALTVKASVLPSDVAHWLERLQAMAEGLRLAAHWRAHAGHGLVHARLRGAEDALLAAVRGLRGVASERGGSLVVTDAPPAAAAVIDVWGPIPALEPMHRLKEQFDPHATLNPGRFVGGI